MKYILFFVISLSFVCCANDGASTKEQPQKDLQTETVLQRYYSSSTLKKITALSKKLKEVSGIETGIDNNLLWMHNDGGNKNILYAVSKKGKIKRKLHIQAKNIDWEDITSDENGNVYIGDFGNNANKRKNLRILKISSKDLHKKNVDVKIIKFAYENQYKFPPKKKDMYFDAEAFFYLNNNFYIFTKSRVKSSYGQTNLYKLPAKKGKQIAKLVSSYRGCSDFACRITAADISPNHKTVALLTLKSILLFTNFKGDDFLNGNVTEVPLNFKSQKEGLCFIDNHSLYITDEKAHGKGGKLYKFRIN